MTQLTYGVYTLLKTHTDDDQYEIKDQPFNESPSSLDAGNTFYRNVQLYLKDPY